MKPKYPIIYAFIDSQNLNLGTSKDIRSKKGKLIYRVAKAFLFIGYIKEYNKMYNNLRRYGYELIFKPTTKDEGGKPKGNVDAELVLHSAAIEFPKYDQAVIVAGDGDYHCLLEYLEKKNKLARIIIPNQKTESSLLKKFHRYKTFLIFEKNKLEYKKWEALRMTRSHKFVSPS